MNNLLSLWTYAKLKNVKLSICQDHFNDLRWNDFFVSKPDFISTDKALKTIPEAWNITDYTHKAFRRANNSLSWRYSLDPKNLFINKPWETLVFRLKREAACNLLSLKPEISNSFSQAFSSCFGAIHVRRGDKLIREGEFTSARSYVTAIESISPEVNDILVLTDDEAVINELEAETSSYRFYLLASHGLAGHQEASFNNLDKRIKKERINRLLSEVALASKSRFFIGAYKSNVSRFIALNHMCPNRCMSVDSLKKWVPT